MPNKYGYGKRTFTRMRYLLPSSWGFISVVSVFDSNLQGNVYEPYLETNKYTIKLWQSFGFMLHHLNSLENLSSIYQDNRKKFLNVFAIFSSG